MDPNKIEFVEAGIENLMPRKEVEYDGKTYTLHLEEIGGNNDRCMGLNTPDSPEYLALFKLTAFGNNSQLNLQALNLENEDTVQTLLGGALGILKEVGEGDSLKVPSGNLGKFIKIGDNSHMISYKPNTRGENMRDKYVEEVMKRIYSD